jgi:hypothetical protein
LKRRGRHLPVPGEVCALCKMGPSAACPGTIDGRMLRTNEHP